MNLTKAIRKLNEKQFNVEGRVDEAVRTKYKNVVLKAKNDIAGLQVKLGDVQDLADNPKHKSAISEAKMHLSAAIKELSKAV